MAVFLKAEWQRLIMVNYLAEPGLLKQYVPEKTELDTHGGNCYISLVGFLFNQVRLKGVKVPFHTRFPEVNLRFYVRYRNGQEWKRGVVFIREIVPLHALRLVANNIFHEKYIRLPMKYTWQEHAGFLHTRYQWKKAGIWHSMDVSARDESLIPAEGSSEWFITEHYWGYARGRTGRTVEYRVEHPRWAVYPVQAYAVNCLFDQVYGPAFSVLNGLTPDSVFLAAGSAVKVYSRQFL